MEQIMAWLELIEEVSGWPAWVWVCWVAVVVVLVPPLVLWARRYEVEIEVRPMPEGWTRRVAVEPGTKRPGCQEQTVWGTGDETSLPAAQLSALRSERDALGEQLARERVSNAALVGDVERAWRIIAELRERLQVLEMVHKGRSVQKLARTEFLGRCAEGQAHE